MFRLAAVFLAPILAVGLLEIVLRIAGFGYPTSFLLLTSHQDGKAIYTQNYRFGYRFFGPRMSRRPKPLYLPQPPPTNTVRIFVFGESAAFGDPRPAFGVSRMLLALLESRYPGVRFEVLNVAMTGINSHVVLPIARDCARAGGDVWVIYMGNNEVVGPFGSGTIFGPQAPPLPLIRTSLCLKSTRTGQLLDSLRQAAAAAGSGPAQWGGMEMFLSQQVAVDDPRMTRVYQHFERNLVDILEAGERSGAGIVLSTIAVNLRDCPPLASNHRDRLSAAEAASWDALYLEGGAAADHGSNAVAAERFEAAARIDDRYAELRFRLGEVDLALGRTNDARAEFIAARDLDTLRFRCDSTLNDLIRQVAEREATRRVRLADAEKAFAANSPDGVSGEKWFYEHVHLTFDGNYLLARTIAGQLDKLLPQWVTNRPGSDWASESDCAARLAWSEFSRAEALRQMVARVNRPPFSRQLHHEQRAHRMEAALEEVSAALDPSRLGEVRAICEHALARAPEDPVLYSLLAFLKLNTGDPAGAALASARQAELLPSDPESWAQLGLARAQQREWPEAAAAFGHALALDPTDMPTALNYAHVQLLTRDVRGAIRTYEYMLRRQPSFSAASIALGQIFEQLGKADKADRYYRQALVNNTDVTQAGTMARFCQGRGMFEAAATNYDIAINLEPADANLRIAAGKNLMDLQRFEAAADQFREAMRIKPNLDEPRLCLGMLYLQQGKNSEAATQFEDVLKQNPTNAVALRYVGLLGSKGSSDKPAPVTQ